MDLTPIASDLWVAAQPLRFLGLEVGSRMSVIRLPSGKLVLISPIELTESDRPALDRFGSVGHIIAPNLFHHLSLGKAQRLYPDAATWGVVGLSDKRPGLRIDALFTQPGTFEGVLDYLPVEGFATVIPQGIRLIQETVFFHRPSSSLILTDTAFNFDATSSPGIRLFAQISGSYAKLQPSWLEKWGSRDKAAVETSIRRVLKWPFDRVIPGHGSIVETNGKAKLRAGYEWFLDTDLGSSTDSGVTA